jgi:hypothetical protein
LGRKGFCNFAKTRTYRIAKKRRTFIFNYVTVIPVPGTRACCEMRTYCQKLRTLHFDNFTVTPVLVAKREHIAKKLRPFHNENFTPILVPKREHFEKKRRTFQIVNFTIIPYWSQDLVLRIRDILERIRFRTNDLPIGIRILLIRILLFLVID